MKRREFISLVVGSAATPMLRPLAAQQAMPVIGLLGTASADVFANRLTWFRQGLRESGFVEGQNVAIEYRWADGQLDRVPALAAELVRRQVAVIVGVSTSDTARAATAATSTIPIVFAIGGDPVVAGLASSLSRPGGNITGVTWLANELQAKMLELLRELLPQVTVVGYLQNPTNFFTEKDAQDMQAAGRALGCEIVLLKAGTAEDISASFTAMVQRRVTALVVQPDPVFSGRSGIIELAAQHRLPTIYANSGFVSRGGLMSYSADINDAFLNAGRYTGRILKGEKPADLPVMQPTKFELAINLKTAKALGIIFPPSFHLRATEVIE